jgi:hypothetical protein
LVRIVDPALHFVRTDPIQIGGDLAQDPSITAFADGAYVISYTDIGFGGQTRVLAKIVSPSGIVGPQFPIGVEELSELATLSNGNFVAVSQDHFGQTFFGIFTKTGVPVAPNTSPGLRARGEPIRMSPHSEMAALSSCGAASVLTTRPTFGR